MTQGANEMAIGAAGLLAFGLAASAWGRVGELSGKVIFVGADRLAAARKEGLALGKGGTWHVWAWQRCGARVEWTLGKTRASAAATGKAGADAFAWVRLAAVDVPADGKLPIAFTPRSAKPADAAVAGAALAREAAFDPARWWRFSRVFPDKPTAAPDERPGRCRHLNMRFTMPDYPTRQAWERRAAWLRRHVRVSCGLVPEPERTPLKPHVFGRIERDGYTIEKAYFESRPGFYACGNLYRPRGREGPFPGVACPHGHWGQGRFGHDPPKGSVPARCITLARLGYVVFSYDMVGYNDSATQVGKHRGVFASRRNELWGLSLMHLQSWNTIRAIDFLQALPDVDGKRIAVTGCSGGGTQTFMVMGIEPRVTAAAPVCMVSGIMQGGCECENAPLLRIETNNIEIAALMAPRPLIVPSATGDWTRETPKVEYPSIRRVYELYEAADRVAGVHTNSGHGYNRTHREGVYTFFRRWMKGIDDGKKIKEPPFQVEKKQDLLVWHGRKLPDGAKTPKQLVEHVVAECRRQRDALLPREPADRKPFRKTAGVAYRHAILASLPKAAELAVHDLGSASLGDVKVTRLLLGRKGAGDAVPAVLYRRKDAAGKAPACVVVHPDGKVALADPAAGAPGKLLAALLAGGRTVLAIDAYLTGEFHSPFAETKQKQDKAYFTTYNRTAVVQRVQDILTALAYLRRRPDAASADLVGLGRAGAWCLLAAPFTPDATRVAADLARLTGDDDPRWLDDLFTPCILKAGGLRTAAALAAPRPLMLHNLAEGFDRKCLRAAYRAAGAGKRLRLETRACGPQALCRWLAAE